MMRTIGFAIALLVATVAGATHAAAPPARPWPLSPVARDRLDRAAYRQPPAGLVRQTADLAGQVPAWLLTRLELPPVVQHRSSKAVHDARLSREKTLPVARDLRRSFDALVFALPAYQNPPVFRWTLAVFDSPSLGASTPGAGYVHVSAPLVRALRADPARGEAALAFVLAREMAHVALGHTRAGWQRHQLEELARNGIASKLEASRWSALLQTEVERVGQLVSFLYTRDQEYEADLFALHLCRNAGFDVDEAIDGLRYFAVLRHPAAPNRADYLPVPAALVPKLAYYCSRADDPLLRLRRLLQERDGRVEPEADFGLFLYERDSDSLRPLAAGDLKAGDRPIVFVHGLHGGLGAWGEFLDAFGQRRELLSRPLVVFHYPATGSIARSGKFLRNRMRALVPEQLPLTFVCYSAGGLVFRTYAEKLSGPFERAAFIATPHGGSDLTQLAFLVDILEFVGLSRRTGLLAAVAQTVANGRGEMKQDLHPDSLFLRYLGRNPRLSARYRILYGETLSRAEALALQLSVRSAGRLAASRLLPHLPDLLQAQAERLFDRLVVPAEILSGDGVVRARSARLPGVPETIRLRRNHLALRSDPEVVRHVLEMIRR